MITVDRYLHFDNIDMEQPEISSQCSHCGQTFKAEPRPGERVDDVLLGIQFASMPEEAGARCIGDGILATRLRESREMVGDASSYPTRPFDAGLIVLEYLP